MKKNLIFSILCMIIIPKTNAQNYYLGVTLTQEIYELSPVEFGGKMSDEALAKGLLTDILATRSLYSRDENFGCPTDEREIQTQNEDSETLHKGRIVIVELEGTCPYGQKVVKAEEDGAAAVIILQKEKSKEFLLAPDEFARRVAIPCFILKDFEQNEKLLTFASSPALIYFAKPVAKNEVVQDTIQRDKKVIDLANVQWTISPNPASEKASISYQLAQDANATFTLSDQNARILQTLKAQSAEGVLFFDLSDYPSGTYNIILQVQTPREKLQQSKILIKQ